MNPTCIVVEVGQALTRIGQGGEPTPRFILPTPSLPPPLTPLWTHSLTRLLSLPASTPIHTISSLPANPSGTANPANPSGTANPANPSAANPSTANPGGGKVEGGGAEHGAVAAGVGTAVVVDVGEAVTRVAAVVQGAPVARADVFADGGVLEVRRGIAEALAEAGQKGSLEVAKRVAEECCLVRPSQDWQPPGKVSDCKLHIAKDLVVVVPASLRVSAYDVLFHDRNDGSDLGIQAAVVRCLKKSPIDARAELAANILVVGGGAMVPGMADRVIHEVRTALAASQAGEVEGGEAGDASLNALAKVANLAKLQCLPSSAQWTGLSLLHKPAAPLFLF